ncbi:MAG: SDR family oxidoreductase [Proteobacteria bacterium]|nr:SDR family oxidoreductase [Pseudomonadota bacterium]
MVLNSFRLDGKVAIVTGSGKGLGKAMAIALAEAGADVAVTARSFDQVQETSGEIEMLGRKCLAVQTDVTKSEEVEALVQQTYERFGRIDILINNVGMAIVKDLMNTTPEDWQTQIATNLTSAFLCCRAVGKHMLEKGGGKIVNVATIAGVRGKWQMTGYGASKAGVIQLTKTLAIEWARYNVSVNCIIPGIFYTSATQNVLDNEKIQKIRVSKVPLKRYGKPEEIGPLAVFLSSPAADFITGVAIPIDGGELAKL